MELFVLFLLYIHDLINVNFEIFTKFIAFINYLWDDFFFLYKNKPSILSIREEGYNLREYIDFLLNEVHTYNADKDKNNE